MIKPSRVVFINDELEEGYNSLKEGDFVKKAITRATRLKRKRFLRDTTTKETDT